MSRCLVFAAYLFDPFRTPANFVRYADGSFTESKQLTAGEIARARRFVAAHPVLCRWLP